MDTYDNRNVEALISKKLREKFMHDILSESNEDDIVGIWEETILEAKVPEKLRNMRANYDAALEKYGNLSEEGSKVVKFPKRQPLGAVHLMAAGGQELGAWFNRPIEMSELGLALEIKQSLDEETKFSIRLNAIEESIPALTEFCEQEIRLIVSKGGTDVFEVPLYVTKTANTAQGYANPLVSLEELAELEGDVGLELLTD